MRIVPVLVAALLAAGAAYALFPRFSPEVRVARPVIGPAVEAVYATGTVEPVHWAKVAPIEAGRIVEIAVQDGEAVAAGQVLARLDDAEAQARLREAEARERYREQELGRQQSLAQRGVASRDALDRARSEAEQARAATAAARQRLAQTLLLSPMDGLVLRRDAEVGEVVERGDAPFWIGQARPLRITAEVDEEDVPRVAVGQTALARSDAWPERVFTSRVAEITPKGDPLSKSFRVRMSLPDDAPLLIGMTVEVNVVVREVADVLLVPAQAVVDGRVFVLTSGRAVARLVTTGIKGRSLVQVVDGLTPDDQILTDPPARLEDGTRVRPLPAEG
ncbi:MAG: efflux RND transporter periplasmic adaptor subunit [Alphaproteobacteria bacterium]|nr:efflux RND transporter periplasmic adaptor subunit [Alphaproteobacteria bacterium]